MTRATPPPPAPTLQKGQKDNDDTTNGVDATSRQRTMRLYWTVGACCVALLIIIIAILAPILTLQNADRSAERLNAIDERSAANDLSRTFRNNLLSASFATYSLAGFVAGKMQFAPPFNASVDERVKDQYFSGFDAMCAHANSSSANLVLMLSAPGGVIYQTVPHMPSMEMVDILNSPYSGASGFGNSSGAESGAVGFGLGLFRLPLVGKAGAGNAEVVRAEASPDCAMVNWPSPFETLRCGGVSILGPTRVIADAIIGPHWYVNLRFPLFISMNPANSTPSTFWGFVYSVLSVTKAVESNQLAVAMRERHMQYLMYTVNDGHIVPISTSFPAAATQIELRNFILKSTVLPIIPNVTLSWLIAVQSTLDEGRVNARTVVTIVLCAVVGTLIALVIAIVLILRFTAEYNGRRYAPKSTPFALVTIGPYNGKELWDLAADEMVAVTESLNKVLEAAMVSAKAYRVQQMHPFTVSYVLSRVEDAVAMCLGVLEQIQKDRIDGPLVRLLGEEECLMLAFALHWCEDASVVAKEGRPLHYSGPDVIFNARMWVFAAPNTVTLSAAAKQQFAPHRRRLGKGMKVLFLNSVFLRGVRHRQDLYNVTDEGNERIREAGRIAAARVRRLRDMRQRRQHERVRGRGVADTVTSPLGENSAENDGKYSLTINALGVENPVLVPFSADRGYGAAPASAPLSACAYPQSSASSPLLGAFVAAGGGGSGAGALPDEHQEVMRMAITSSVLGSAGPISGSSASGGHSRLRQTRAVNPLSVPHPLLYYRQDAVGHRAGDSGSLPSTSSTASRAGRYVTGQNELGSRSTRSRATSSASRGSSTDEAADSLLSDHGPRYSTSRRSSTTVQAGGSLVDIILTGNPSSPVASTVPGTSSGLLVGHLSGGLVVPTSVRSANLDRSPPSLNILSNATLTQLQLDSPLMLSESDALPQVAVSHVVPPSTVMSGFPTPLSSNDEGDSEGDDDGKNGKDGGRRRGRHASRRGGTSIVVPSMPLSGGSSGSSSGSSSPCSSRSIDSAFFAVPLPGHSTTMAARSVTTARAAPPAVCAPISSAHDVSARPTSTTDKVTLPSSVTVGPDGRFMIAPPSFVSEQTISAIKARRQQQTQRLRDPLSKLTGADDLGPTTPLRDDADEAKLSTSRPFADGASGHRRRRTKTAHARRHAPHSVAAAAVPHLTTTAVAVSSSSSSRRVSPVEGVLSIASSSTSSVRSSGSGFPPRACTSRHGARLSRCETDDDAVDNVVADDDAADVNPLSNGGAVAATAASTSLSPAFPVVMGSSAVSLSACSSMTVSRTASGVRLSSVGDDGDGTGVGHGGAGATDSLPQAPLRGAGVAAASVSTGSNTTASVMRQCTSVSRTTNVTGSAPLAASSATRGSEMVVPLLRAITHPVIPEWLDQQLRDSFEQQSIALDVSYDSLRIIIYYVYFGCKLLMRPLSPAQRTSIYRRLIGNSGVPQQSVLVYLSTRCVIQFVQQHEEQHSLLWDRQLQQQEMGQMYKVQ